MALPVFKIEVESDIGNFVETYARELRVGLVRPRPELRAAIEDSIRFGPRNDGGFKDGSIEGQLQAGGTYEGTSFVKWPDAQQWGWYGGTNAPMRRSESGEPGSSASRGGKPFSEFWKEAPIRFSRGGASIVPKFNSGDGVRFRIYQQRNATVVRGSDRMRKALRAIYGINVGSKPQDGFVIEPRQIRANRHMARHVEFVIGEYARKFHRDLRERLRGKAKKRYS